MVRRIDVRDAGGQAAALRLKMTERVVAGMGRIAQFTRTDNSTGTIADVALATDEADSRWLGDSTVSPAAAANENIPPLHAVRKAA